MDAMTQAWYTANFSGAAFVGKMPELKDVVEPYREATETRPKVLKSDAKQRELEMMVALANFSDRLPKRHADETPSE